jgi:hypothetical protein
VFCELLDETEGAYAGTVRVVTFCAMAAMMAPRALLRSPAVSAKYAEVVPPATAIFWSSQQALKVGSLVTHRESVGVMVWQSTPLMRLMAKPMTNVLTG